VDIYLSSDYYTDEYEVPSPCCPRASARIHPEKALDRALQVFWRKVTRVHRSPTLRSHGINRPVSMPPLETSKRCSKAVTDTPRARAYICQACKNPRAGRRRTPVARVRGPLDNQQSAGMPHGPKRAGLWRCCGLHPRGSRLPPCCRQAAIHSASSALFQKATLQQSGSADWPASSPPSFMNAVQAASGATPPNSDDRRDRLRAWPDDLDCPICRPSDAFAPWHEVRKRIKVSTDLPMKAIRYFCALNDVVSARSVFTCQGKLSDNGVAANGSYDLAISLWDSIAGGAQSAVHQPQVQPSSPTEFLQSSLISE